MARILEQEFRSRVLAHAAKGLKPWSLSYAINLYLKKKEILGEQDIGACVEVAKEFERFYQQRLQEDDLDSYPQLRTEHSSPPVGELMASDVAIEWLTPHIEQVRQDLFGCHTAPFATYEAAVEWLVSLGNEQWKRWKERNEQKQREFRQKTGKGGIFLFWEPEESAIQQARRKAGALFHISYERRCIKYTTSREDLIPEDHKHLYYMFRQRHPDLYPRVEAWLWSIEIYEDSVLAKLEDAAYKIADGTGFYIDDVVAWVLADKQPVSPPFRMHNEYKRLKLSNGSTLENKYVVIEVLEPEHLSYNQLKQIYHSIREDFHVTRVKALTVSHQRLQHIVKRLGGVPMKHGSKRAFWERVRQEWNREVGREEYSSWRPLEMRYKRLSKKLKSSA